jgi:hypothetical protein
MSTPYFINDLTDISLRILQSENKMEFLQESL